MRALKAWLVRLKIRWFPKPASQKVGAAGVWLPGSMLDLGDSYVAYIDVNGDVGCIAVRAATKATAKQRRDQIIDAVRASSGAPTQPGVQIIARTSGGRTVEYH